jgi:hypothetical protein
MHQHRERKEQQREHRDRRRLRDTRQGHVVLAHAPDRDQHLHQRKPQRHRQREVGEFDHHRETPLKTLPIMTLPS